MCHALGVSDLGVTIDKKLNFKSHVNSLCIKASHKLHAIARISTYMEKPQLELNFHNVTFQLLPTCVDVSRYSFK